MDSKRRADGLLTSVAVKETSSRRKEGRKADEAGNDARFHSKQGGRTGKDRHSFGNRLPYPMQGTGRRKIVRISCIRVGL